MKLLFVIPEYPPHAGGGIITWYRTLLPELARQGHTVHALVGSALSPTFPDYEADGVSVEFLNADKVSENLEKFTHYSVMPEFQRHLAAAWTAWEQVNGGSGYDLVETTDWGLLFVPWIVQDQNPPVVVQLHGSIGQIDFYDPKEGDELQGHLVRLLEMQLLFLADEVQTYSHNNAAEWSFLANREIAYIPPALVPSAGAGIPDEVSDFGLVVGRIQHWKGPALLCEALRLLGDSAPTIQWVGRDTPFQGKTNSLSAYLKRTYPDVWEKQILPIGPRPPEETAKFQASAEFIIVPSLWDVFNFTCIEGMGYGKVVLCSTGAGASDLIEDGVNGLIFSPNEPTTLAEKIQYFQGMSPDSRRRMGELARETIVNVLAPKVVAKRRRTAYQELILKGKSSSRPNQWLSAAVSPHQGSSQPLAFLDHLPLRQITHYTLQRGTQKLRRKQ